MAKEETMKVEQIKNELLRYISTKPKLLQAAILSKEILLNRHSTPRSGLLTEKCNSAKR